MFISGEYVCQFESRRVICGFEGFSYTVVKLMTCRN